MLEFLYKINRWLVDGDKGRQKTIVPNKETMTREQAIAKAKEEVVGRGWNWLEPIDIVLIEDDRSGRQTWSINTNFLSRGCRAYIVLDGETGEVLRAQYDSR